MGTDGTTEVGGADGDGGAGVVEVLRLGGVVEGRAGDDGADGGADVCAERVGAAVGGPETGAGVRDGPGALEAGAGPCGGLGGACIADAGRTRK